MYEYETEPTEAETAELETVTAWLEGCADCRATPGHHAGLHVGHVWTEVRCPAYRSLDGADCTCNREAGSAALALLLCAPGLVVALVFTVRILAALTGVADTLATSLGAVAGGLS